MTARRRRRIILVAAIVGVVLVLAGVGAIATWELFSGSNHRATIERIASGLAGRPVRIRGTIRLALIPAPQIVAENVLIGGKGGSVAARSLKLDLATKALLVGRLRATRLSLTAPQIDLPWPLPGGADAVAPPPWLASLHASVVDGTIRIGLLHFTHADLSVFTGGPHAVLAVGGTARLEGVPVKLTLNLARPDHGRSDFIRPAREPASAMYASLALVDAPGAKLELQGRFDNRSTLSGRITGGADPAGLKALGLDRFLRDQAATIAADFRADGKTVAIDHAVLNAGTARVSGSLERSIDARAVPHVELMANGIDISGAEQVLHTVLPAVVLHLRLDHVTFGKVAIPDLTTELAIDPEETRIDSLTAAFGKGTITLHGRVSRSDGLRGDFKLSAPHLAGLIANLRQRVPGLPMRLVALPWTDAPITLAGRVTADADSLAGFDLRGTIGTGPAKADWTGAVSAGLGKIRYLAASLDFSDVTLDPRELAASAAVLRAADPANAEPTPVEVSLRAGHFRVAKGPGAHGEMFDAGNLVIDAGIGRRIDLREAGFTMAGAKLLARGAIDADGTVGDAALDIEGADAASSLEMLGLMRAKTPGEKVEWRKKTESEKDAALRRPFSIGITAAGPPHRLDIGFKIRLGAISASGQQMVDVDGPSSTGNFAIRAPSAIALLRGFGIAGNLDWPGAGSASVRARDVIIGTKFDLPDIVASFGASTLSGHLGLEPAAVPKLAGQIDFDNLTAPALPGLLDFAHAALAWNLDIAIPAIIARNVTIAEERVAEKARIGIDLAGSGPTRRLAVSLEANPDVGGTLNAQAIMLPKAGAIPERVALGVHLADAPAAGLAALADKNGVSLPLLGGMVELDAALDANGTGPADWAKTASGGLNATGTKLIVGNLDLAKAAEIFHAATGRTHRISRGTAGVMLRRALSMGQTEFATAVLDAKLADGRVTIGEGKFVGPDGAFELTGSASLSKVMLQLIAIPRGSPSFALPHVPQRIVGNAASPRRITDLAPAMRWILRLTRK